MYFLYHYKACSYETDILRHLYKTRGYEICNFYNNIKRWPITVPHTKPSYILPNPQIIFITSVGNRA